MINTVVIAPCAETKEAAEATESVARERKQKADDARAAAEEKRQAAEYKVEAFAKSHAPVLSATLDA